MALLLDRTAAARGGRPRRPGRVGRPAPGGAPGWTGCRWRSSWPRPGCGCSRAGQLAERLDDVLGSAGRRARDARNRPRRRADAGSPTSRTPWTWSPAAPGTAPRPGTRAVQRRRPSGTSPCRRRSTWSYRTLGPRAARLLRWLAVFAGPVDLATVEWLLDDDPLDPLSVLVDKSMVQAEPHASGSTYRMLDPIRAYAARRLVDAGEEQAARDRHVAWSLHALRRAHLGPDGRPVTLSLYALDPLADELRAALRWTATGGSARQGLRLAGGLDQWWRERGLAREGRLWLFRLYGRIAETGEQVPEAELAAAYHMHSLHAGADGEFAEELRFSQRAEAAARQAGDAGLLARVLAGRAAPLVDMGQFAEAERVCREVIDWAGRAGGRRGRAAGRLQPGRAAVAAAARWTRRRSCSGRPGRWRRRRPAERGQRRVDMLLGMVALARRRPGGRARPPGGGAALPDESRLPRPGLRHGERDRGALRAGRRPDDGGPALRRGPGSPGPGDALRARHLRRVLDAAAGGAAGVPSATRPSTPRTPRAPSWAWRRRRRWRWRWSTRTWPPARSGSPRSTRHVSRHAPARPSTVSRGRSWSRRTRAGTGPPEARCTGRPVTP